MTVTLILEKNLSIVGWVAILSKSLKDYLSMQCIKRSSTARISEKRSKRKIKPIPKIVFKYGEQHRKVKWFLEARRFLLDSLKRLKKQAKRNRQK